VDVGVNLGQTLLAVKSIRSDWPYFGFEPNPHCVSYVARLIEANRLERCTVFPFAIGADTGVFDLRARSLAGGEGSIVDGFRRDDFYQHTIKVPVLGPGALPEELDEHRIGVLKIDVEGGELEVVRTLEPLIARDRPAVVVELLPTYGGGPDGPGSRQQRQDELLAILERLDYATIRLHRDGTRELLDTIEPHSRLDWVDYLFVPRGSEQQFL
jgi:FkbM family methyltransferase